MSLNFKTRNFNAHGILCVLVTCVLASTRAEVLGTDAKVVIPQHGPVFVASLSIHERNTSLRISAADKQNSRDGSYGGLGFLAVMDRDRTVRNVPWIEYGIIK